MQKWTTTLFLPIIINAILPKPIQYTKYSKMRPSCSLRTSRLPKPFHYALKKRVRHSVTASRTNNAYHRSPWTLTYRHWRERKCETEREGEREKRAVKILLCINSKSELCPQKEARNMYPVKCMHSLWSQTHFRRGSISTPEACSFLRSPIDFLSFPCRLSPVRS